MYARQHCSAGDFGWGIIEVPMGYSQIIRGVFTAYSCDIRMHEVCVGYVSGMCRVSIGKI